MADLKIRCNAGGCECKNFSAANKELLRICENCNHSWITHLLEKLLTPRDDALSIFDVCSLALYGTHALPIRLKIVIERLLATLQADEIDKILRSFGWTHQDLARGYMIHDSRGHPLARWSMLPREEEILILQQFLRFNSTRTLSFALLREDFPLPPPLPPTSNNHSPKSPQSQQNKLNHGTLQPPVTPHSQASHHVKSPLHHLSKSHGHPILNLSTQSSSEDEDPRGVMGDSAVDLSSKRTVHSSPQGVIKTMEDRHRPKETRQKERGDSSFLKTKNQPIKKQWNPIPTPTHVVNPATGKRRVQCSVCLKTFCDKGALKIHFSAVHLREMHKCTVSGCNMMFSSRRSRNRHSANPNPKLHAPHLRRKISPHDGRTCQPQGIVNPLLLSPIRFPPFLQGSHQSLSPNEDLKHDGTNETNSSRAEDDVSDLGFSSPEGIAMDMGEEDESEIQDEQKSPPEAQEKGRDGARKRKLTNPVRLASVADDSNEDFCCYDDGTEVMDEEEDEGDGKKSDTSVSADEKSVKASSPSSPASNLNGNGEIHVKREADLIEREKNNGGSPRRKKESGEEERDGEEPGEGNHLGRLESMPIFSSPHHSNEDSSSLKGSEDEENINDLDIPLDNENPRRCSVCGKMFQNHFGVKTHYQNVHLKLMHKCTVDGCNAAFPSKRSRDRHASNLNLHRKLLSTSDIPNGSESPSPPPTTEHNSESSSVNPHFNPFFFQNHNGSKNQDNHNHPSDIKDKNSFTPSSLSPTDEKKKNSGSNGLIDNGKHLPFPFLFNQDGLDGKVLPPNLFQWNPYLPFFPPTAFDIPAPLPNKNHS